jgi:hypothetical protein
MKESDHEFPREHVRAGRRKSFARVQIEPTAGDRRSIGPAS